jgi:hypothetical protein
MMKKLMFLLFLGIVILTAGCSAFEDYLDYPESGQARMNKNMDHKMRSGQTGGQFGTQANTHL